MEAWQRRYKDRKEEAYYKYRDRLMKTIKPGYIRPTTFTEVVHQTAMQMAEKYMTSLLMVERNG